MKRIDVKKIAFKPEFDLRGRGFSNDRDQLEVRQVSGPRQISDVPEQAVPLPRMTETVVSFVWNLG